MSEDPISDEAIGLPEAPPGWHDLNYAVTPEGSLALIRCDRDHWTAYRAWIEQSRAVTIKELKRGAVRPARPTLSGARLRLSRFDGTTETDPIEIGLETWGVVVAPLPDAGWLVSAGEHFHRYTGAGIRAGSVDLGQFIDHFTVTPQGTMWVGYFDEGILRHANPEGTLPVSTAGIASFAADGTELWRFNSSDHGVFVSGSYALTADGERVWACIYTDFPIVRIENGEVRSWANEEVGGPSGIAAEGDHVVLAGGYRDDELPALAAGRDTRLDHVALLRLRGDTATLIDEWRVEPVNPVSAHLIQGLGSTMHVVRNGTWRRLTVAMLLEASRSKAARFGRALP